MAPTVAGQSLLDNPEFVAELANLDGVRRRSAPVRVSAGASPVSGRLPIGEDVLDGLDDGLGVHEPDSGDAAIQRRLQAPPRVVAEPPSPVEATIGPSPMAVALVLLLGVSAGAGAAALVFHEQLVALLR